MKKLILLVSMVFIASSAYAGGAFETTDEAQARHSAERYNTYGNNQPLGGYSEKLGDSSPLTSNNSGYGSSNSNSSSNESVPRYGGSHIRSN
jgi:hypothetical protein